jgi:hypothetical protein
MLQQLTPRQSRFVDEYLVDLNATQAAIRAGYSARTANEQGPRLLVNVRIATAIQIAQEVRSQRVLITQDDVLRGLHREATRRHHAQTYVKLGTVFAQSPRAVLDLRPAPRASLISAAKGLFRYVSDMRALPDGAVLLGAKGLFRYDPALARFRANPPPPRSRLGAVDRAACASAHGATR